MSRVEDFLTKEEEAEIVEAIRVSELNTSGEIRVHLEKKSSIAHLDRAMEVFHFLKMDNTKDRNGVLIYIAVKDKTFVIYGDKGIYNKVPNDFWNSTKEIMQHHFRNNEFKKGIIEGIFKAGEQLKKYFPYENNDKNELSNEISRG
jgi:uncharacterized membrane protein